MDPARMYLADYEARHREATLRIEVERTRRQAERMAADPAPARAPRAPWVAFPALVRRRVRRAL